MHCVMVGLSKTFFAVLREFQHAHPLSLTLMVTASYGWTHCESESIIETRADDLIWMEHVMVNSITPVKSIVVL